MSTLWFDSMLEIATICNIVAVHNSATRIGTVQMQKLKGFHRGQESLTDFVLMTKYGPTNEQMNARLFLALDIPIFGGFSDVGRIQPCQDRP